MENKKYLDKVLDHLVRGTKISVDGDGEVYPPYSLNLPPPISVTTFIIATTEFSRYCKNQFGLTQKEIKHLWPKYVRIILNKIRDGERKHKEFIEWTIRNI